MRYRIVHDIYAGYEVQTRRWWFPIWIQHRCNTFLSVDAAHAYGRGVTKQVVE